MAASLNDLITSPSNGVRSIFGQDAGVPLFKFLFAVYNADFKTDPGGDVVIRLNEDRLLASDIQILVDGKPAGDPLTLLSLADNIESQWALSHHTAAVSQQPLSAVSSQLTERQSRWRDRLNQALVGLARRLILPAGVDRSDLLRAIELAEEGHGLLVKKSRRPEWKRYAQIWLGWGHARLAETPLELEQADDNFFVSAIVDLRNAGLRMDLAEALFQRARMLASEGKRLQTRHHEQIVESLAEAVEQANTLRLTSLTRRYLGLAQQLDPDVWIRTLTRHKRIAADVSATNRRLHAMVEDRLNALYLVSHELAQPAMALNLLHDNKSSQSVTEDDWKTVGAAAKRLLGVAHTLNLLRVPMDFSGRWLPSSLKGSIKSESIPKVLQETKHSLALVADEKKVTIELETEPELTWDTIPELLQNIVYNLAHNAVKFAGKSSGGNKSGSNKGGRVLLRAQRMDQNLWIDVLNTGHPLDVRHSDQVFIRGTTTSDDFPSLTPHGYGLCQLVTINGRSCWTIAGLES